MTRRVPKPAEKLRQAAHANLRNAYQEAILDGASRVFVRLGLREARMSDLAEEIGVSVGTLYNYFESKEQVIDALAFRECAEFTSRMVKVSEVEGAIAKLSALVLMVFSFVEEHGALFATYTQLGMSSETDLKCIGGSKVHDGYVGMLQTIDTLLQESADAGLIRCDIPSRLLAASLGGLMNAMIFTWLQDGRRDSLVERRAVVLDLFMKGAAKP